MWTKLVLAFMVFGCVRLAHVEPQIRLYHEASDTVVEVESRCGYDSTFHAGQGVIISERHVLTAAHVVSCPDIPQVWVTLKDGTRHRAVVTREDNNADIARVELIHAGRFGLDIPPPLLAPVPYDVDENDYVCLYTYTQEPQCVLRISPTLIAIRVSHGTSGAPVYDNGQLVGLVIRDTYSATRITLVTPEWLEGT